MNVQKNTKRIFHFSLSSPIFLGIFALLLVLASSLFIFVSRADAATPPGNLILYYKLDERPTNNGSVTDSSGSGFTGYFTGNGQPTDNDDVPSVDFRDSGSFFFNGDDAIQGPTYDDLDATGVITVSAWFKAKNFDGLQKIISTTQYGGYSIELNGSSTANYGCQAGNICFKIATKNSSTRSPLNAVYYSAQASFSNLNLEPDVWTNVTGTYDPASGVLTLYVNGNEVNSNNSSGGGIFAPTAGTPFCVGAEATNHNCSGRINFYGWIDDVRVYNRELTTTEIQDIAAGKMLPAVWNGSRSTDFYKSSNWTPAVVPDVTTDVTIPVPSKYDYAPHLVQNTAVASLTMDAGASFYAGHDALSINNGESGLSNDGTIYMNRNGSLLDTDGNYINDTNSGTVVLLSNGSYSGPLPAGNDYYNLVLKSETDDTSETTLSSPLAVNGTLTIKPKHELNLFGYNVSVAGNFSNDGIVSANSSTINIGGDWATTGTFNAGTSNVNLNGNDQAITGGNTFYNLTKYSTSPHTLTFEADKTQTVTNKLTLHGAKDNLLSLLSSSPSTAWKLNASGDYDFNPYLKVTDSDNVSTGTNAFLGAPNSTDGGGNTDWDFLAPNTPTASVSSGLYTSNQTVTLSATDTDPGSGIDAIYYTTDGTTPSETNGMKIASGDTVTISQPTTLKAIAYDNAGIASSVLTKTYIIHKPGGGDTGDTTAPDTPSAEPTGTTTESSQTVTLTASDNDGGSGLFGIFYTTDGTTPTATSTMIASGESITVEKTETVKSVAYDNAGNESGVMTETYYIKNSGGGGDGGDTTAPDAPTASPSSKTFTGSLNVTLSSDASDLFAIYYTTNDSTPTKKSTQYTNPLSIDKTETLKAIAVDDSGNESDITTETYFNKNSERGGGSGGGGDTGSDTTAPSAPSLSPKSGTSSKSLSVTLSATDTGGSGLYGIFYTTDGSTPTATSTKIASGDTITVEKTETVRAIAYDNAGNKSSVTTETYFIQTSGNDTTGDTVAPNTPTADPSGGTFTGSQAVKFTATDTGGSGLFGIFYTTDGSTPTATSTMVASGNSITVDHTATLQAIAYDNAGNKSAVFSADYVIQGKGNGDSGDNGGGDDGNGDGGGNGNGDGGDGGGSGDNGGGGDTGGTTNPHAPTTPQASVSAGTYTADQSVELSSTDPDGDLFAIYYTTDGTTPTASSKKYTGAISVSMTETIMAIAYDRAGHQSGVMNNTYFINTQGDGSGGNSGDSGGGTGDSGDSGGDTGEGGDTTAPATPSASPIGDTYTQNQSVTLSSSDNSGGSGLFNIYYTKNGSTPSVTSTRYTSSIDVDSSETLRAIAYDNAGNASLVMTETYFIQTSDNGTDNDTTAPTAPTSTPSSGTYTGSQSVKLSSSDADSGVFGIFYTTDGTMPTATSSVVANNGHVTVSKSETLTMIAYDNAGNASDVASSTYTIKKKSSNSDGGSAEFNGSSFGTSYLPGYGPSAGNGTTKTDKQALIAKLQKQIAFLRAQISALTGEGSVGTAQSSFDRDLELGSTGSDVKALQHFLNTHGYPIAVSGVGSLGEETTYFGTLTQNAVIKYQTAKGITPTAGYFGPITRASVEGKTESVFGSL